MSSPTNRLGRAIAKTASNEPGGGSAGQKLWAPLVHPVQRKQPQLPVLASHFQSMRAGPNARLQPLPGSRRHLGSHAGTAQSDRMIATTSRPVTAVTPADHPLLRTLLSKPYPAVMGVLNVTPDSFSDGGQFVVPDRALAQAKAMIAGGADIIDVGAESTRPYGGSQPVSVDEELKRLRPILRELVSLGLPVSIDSMKPAVVAFALDAGAVIANDVWGLQRDPDMPTEAAAGNVSVLVM